MCGIVGYTGPRQALPFVLEGLRRLEYRGYDSAGVAVLDGDGRPAHRQEGRRAGQPRAATSTPARSRCNGPTGIGHTRWATHGGPTDRNAHPHTDASGRVAVIHNGIIENFAPLRTRTRGQRRRDAQRHRHRGGRAPARRRRSPTARPPATCRPAWPPSAAAWTARSPWSPMHADVPDMLVAARRNSPLVVGVGDGEMFVASDVAAFIAHTREAVELGQDQLVVITPDGYEITSFTGGERRLPRVPRRLGPGRRRKGRLSTSSWTRRSPSSPQRSPTPCSGTSTAPASCWTSSGSSDDELRTIDKVFVVACGTAYHSGLIAKYAIEHWTRIPVEVEVASEFRYRDPVLDRDTLVVAVSQSGETADTLEAVRHARRQRARVLAVCNTNGSQIPRESDAVLYTHAGPEIGVAVDQDVPGPGDRQLPGRAGAGAGPRHQVPRRDRPRVRAAVARCRTRSRRR